MGHVTKRGNRYLARWRSPDGVEHSRSFRRKLDADRFLVTVAADILRGTYIDPRAGKVTVATYAAAWAEGQPWRPQSRRKNEQNLRLHILPTLGGRPIGSLRPSEIQTWVTALAKSMAPRTVTSVYGTLAAVLRAAVDDHLIPVSPAKLVRLPRQTKTAIVPLTLEQVSALHDAMPSRWQAFIPVCAGLGLRRGEALGLTVDRVDFLRRQVTIDRQLIGTELAATKTPASNATIPLPGSVAEVLAEHVRTLAVHDGLLFTTENGGPVTASRIDKAFQRARQNSGIDATIHDLRHFCASALINAGCSVVAVQHFLRHENATITLNIYGHLWPSDDERIRAAVDRVLEAPAGSVRDAATR